MSNMAHCLTLIAFPTRPAQSGLMVLAMDSAAVEAAMLDSGEDLVARRNAMSQCTLRHNNLQLFIIFKCRS